jgi:hypothetical protein
MLSLELNGNPEDEELSDTADDDQGEVETN